MSQMLQIGLDNITEDELRRLVGTPETFAVEFKRELDLSKPDKRLEAAKDISALANSQGGRLFYGISEKALGYGLRVADALVPLTDGALQTRLEDVVSDGIHPRPHCRLRGVPVAGGFILVVEVYPSVGRDLHMTHDYRFYRRGETRTIKMTEPEVREAYGRLALSSLTLEKALESTVAERLKQAPKYGQSVLVVPWYPRRDLADPRSLAGIGRALADGPFHDYRRQPTSAYWEAIANLESCGEGLRSSDRRIREVPHFRVTITRSGLIQLDDADVVRGTSSGERPYFLTLSAARNVLVALEAAKMILERCTYWGPVNVVTVLSMPPETSAILLGSRVHPRTLTAARIELAVAEVNLIERGTDLEPVVREICDQLFQHLGDIACPYFSEDGHLIEAVKALLPMA